MPTIPSSQRFLSQALVLCALLLSACGGESPRGAGEGMDAQAPRVRVFNLDGELTDPFQATNAIATVFLFIATDCPISNRYAPEVQRLHSEFASKGVAFWLVYPDPATSAEAIRKHLKDYRYSLASLRDPDHSLVKRTGARVTPEAVVLNRRREIVYRGRIDDRYVELGKERPTATRRDLKEVLAALVAGKTWPFSSAPAVGCYIGD